VIWVEGSQPTDAATIYRFPAEVLPRALLPHLASAPPDQVKAGIDEMIPHIVDAMDALAKYFVAAVNGYLRDHGGLSHIR